MNFCNHCGAPVTVKVPDGDHLPRHVCERCGTIHYQNPKVVVGCIPAWDDKILLCKRAIEPRLGFWTLPAGFMENGESARDGAARETLEEANARVEIGALYSLFNLPHIGQIYLLFRARLLDLDYSPGDESTEVRLFAEEDIPWSELAFAAVTETLKLFFADHASPGTMPRCGDIYRETERNSGAGQHYQVRLY
ncbi:NUDIX hydrolase [Thiorhodovibrio frisius]|uniref:ADP-ribose pyrophosphatase n=1 Tax=Thiorhodovibrio frisius TaxID=631362 RepID=H8YWW3_9GAMM|nr:NUDIX hydrolase [Thiorhodovibrio frisius]EIC22939.1 ADP-ribose pyrophosphatase [Thiorhodovibrio frisius]WPL22802.1 NADH pyrophosphatase [Thiorhodovibrio frisius]